MCHASRPQSRKIEANIIPSPYSAASVRRKTPASNDQLVGWSGTSKSQTPVTVIAVARMRVVVMPPRAMPVRMPIIGAGDMM